MKSEVLNVTGMSGRACVSVVTNALKSVPGVEQVSVSLSPDQAIVRFDEGRASSQQLQDALALSGYGVAPKDSCGGCCGGCGGG
jgi:copper chaperone CopZ